MEIPDQFNFIKWLKEDTVALVNDDQGKKFVLKESLRTDVLVRISETIKQYTRTLRTFIPHLHGQGNYLYYVYIDGQKAGDTTQDYGFKEESLKKISPELIATCLYELQGVSQADFLTQKSLEKRNSYWYINNLLETKEDVVKEFDQFYFDSIDQYLRKYGRTIDSLSNIIVHGDLHPHNIYVNCLLGGVARDFAVTDWDLMHFNNPGFDLADLKIWSWRDPKWFDKVQIKSEEYWKQSEVDIKPYINFCSVYLACQMIRHVHLTAGQCDNQSMENAKSLLEYSKGMLKKLVV